MGCALAFLALAVFLCTAGLEAAKDTAVGWAVSCIVVAFLALLSAIIQLAMWWLA